jgi:hypothetical protein
MLENTHKRVAIIGAGPSGFTAAVAALKLGYYVELVDPWLIAEPNLNSEIDLNVKTRFGSSKMYDYPSKFIIGENGLRVAATTVVGGFSTIWGAGLNFDTGLFKGVYDQQLINQAEATVRGIFEDFNEPHFVSERFMKILKKPNNGFTISELALSASRCNLSGKCMTGCLENAIWSCENQWKELVQSQVILRKGLAKKIQDVDNQVLVSIEQEDRVQIYKYDFVLVACGAMASASLGQRSGFFPVSVQMGETAISYLPLFIFSKIRPYIERRFTLSQVFYSKKNFKKNETFFVSLFESSGFLKEQAQLKLGWKIRLIPEIFWGYLGVGIHYTPESQSHKLVLDLKDEVSIVSIQNASKRKSGLYFWKFFRNVVIDFYRSRIFFFPLIRIKGKAGTSYHLGHLTSNGVDLLDRSGKIGEDSRVCFVDSLSLSALPPGPITAIAMINTWLKTTSLLTHRPE